MDNTTKKQAASLKVMAALLGEEIIDRFGKIVAEHFKHGNVKGIKEAIKLLGQALDLGASLDEDTVKEAAKGAKITDVIDDVDDVDDDIKEALGVDNLKPTDDKDNVRIVLALRLRKNDKGKFRVAGNVIASSVGHPDADDDTVTMRQILSAFCVSGINTFLKELAKGDETSVGLFESLKEDIDNVD